MNTRLKKLIKQFRKVIGKDEKTKSDKFSSDPNICFGRQYRDKFKAKQREILKTIRERIKK